MDAADMRSSSSDLSSAPNNDVEGPNPDRVGALSNSNTIVVATSSPLSTSVYPPPSAKSTATAGAGVDAAPPVKVRKPRKKKDDASAPPVEKEKKPRKPRAASGAGPGARKKVKTEDATGTSPLAHNVPLATIVPSVSASANQPAPSISTPTPMQNGFAHEHSTTSLSSQPPPPPPPGQTHPLPPPIPRSKPIFDPIRGVVVDRSVPTPPITSPVQSTPPRTILNPSNSPAISSIIHQTGPTPTAPVQHPSDVSAANTATTDTPPLPNHPSNDGSAMEVDQPPPPDKKTEGTTTKPVTKSKAKEQPPPLPTGSGLLSSSLFGGDSGLDAKSMDEKGPNIVLHIDLKDPNNKVINFARMAEDKYGFAALYPRQAAQKERLAKVAAAGAALERASAGPKGGTSASDSADEDGSVDIDRDSDNDGDAVMSGMNGKGDVGNSGTDGPAPTKRRKRKDEYDADDPFVDDSEMLWEAQAAASKDGFFVYIGPLVPEGEKATVERADGTVKRGRGRGRGGGPGSRGGRGGLAAAQAEGGTARGGGPGSRGGGITRKPRISKAERQQRDLDKKKPREPTTVLAAKPPSAPP